MYGYFDHDADVGVFGRGATIEQAFENAARAMFALMWEPRDVVMRDEVEVAFEEADAEWLGELDTEAVQKIVDVGFRLNGIGSNALEEAAKN